MTIIEYNLYKEQFSNFLVIRTLYKSMMSVTQREKKNYHYKIHIFLCILHSNLYQLFMHYCFRLYTNNKVLVGTFKILYIVYC